MGYVQENVEVFFKENFSALSCFALDLEKWSGRQTEVLEIKK